MKVCFLSSLHPPFDKRVFEKEARSLAAAGFEVIHVAPGNIETQLKHGVLIKTYENRKGILGRAFSILALCRKAGSVDADVYHCNEVDSWIAGLLLKILRRGRVIFDVHEHYPTIFGYGRFPSWLQTISAITIRILFRCLTPFTDYLIFAKKSVARDFPNCEGKSAIVYNYTPVYNENIRIVDVTSNVRNTFDGKFTAVHLGLFNKNRGWLQLLYALTKIDIPNFQFVSIGIINDGSEKKFWETAEELGVEKRITLKPWLPFEEAYWHLLCSQVGLVLFQPEDLNNVYAFPHKLFDYMLAGLPVIVPEFAIEITPIVKKYSCGILVDSTNSDDIANAINSMGVSEKERISMGIRGREAVIKECNWESQGEKLVKAYRVLS